MRPETEKIVTIVKEAGKIALKYFTELQADHISTKDDGSILTIADTEVDHYLRTELEKAFPEYSVLSEESKNTRITEGVFIIDPIDGTKNFSEGNDNFGISVGLVINGSPEIGVVFAPATNTLYVGEKGGHAYCNNKIIKVSTQDSFVDMNLILHTGRSPKTLEIHEVLIALFEKEGARVETIKTCASLDLCRVADGSHDAFVHRGLNAWDIAAGIAILEVAGGAVCHFNGSKKDLFTPNIIGTTPLLKEKLVACILTAGV